MSTFKYSQGQYTQILDVSSDMALDSKEIFNCMSKNDHSSYLNEHNKFQDTRISSELMDRIANIFWRASLTFHPFKFGDCPVTFVSLWPKGDSLQTLLLECVISTDLRKSVVDIALLALKCGPVQVLQTLVDGKIIGIKHQFNNGLTMLHVACIHQNYDAVVYLLQSKISTKVKDKSGRTGDDVCFCPQIKKVLASKSLLKTPPKEKVQSKQKPSLQERDQLFNMAAHTRDCDELLYKLQLFEFDINSETDSKGNYIIHIVVKQGVCRLPLLLNLVRICGADVNVIGSEGITPLSLAVCSGNVALVEILVCVLGANPNLQNPESLWTPLHYAASGNHVEVVRCLLKRGSDPNMETNTGALAEELAARNKAIDCKEIVQAERLERVKTLSRIVAQEELKKHCLRKSDLFAVDGQGRTLVMIAVIYNRCGNLRYLLEMDGCPVNAQHEKTGRTALAIAASESHLESVKVLLRYGADPRIVDVDGYLPLHHAVENSHLEVVELMLQFQSCLTGLQRAFSQAKNPQIQAMVAMAMERRQVEIVTPVLFHCSMNGNAESLFCILEDGDIVNPLNGVHDWPAYIAAENGHLEVVKLLYERGGDIASQHPTTRCSPLHVACARGHLEVVRFILLMFKEKRKGIHVEHHQGQGKELNLNAYDKRGLTPLQLAAEKGYSKIVKALLVAGATTALLTRSGCLYSCDEYQGVQVLIETFRKKDTDFIMGCIREGRQELRNLRHAWLPKFDHNLRDRKGDTPLMVACATAGIEILRFLLESAVYHTQEEDGSDYSRTIYEESGETFCSDSGTVADDSNPSWLHSAIRGNTATEVEISSSDNAPSPLNKAAFHMSFNFQRNKSHKRLQRCSAGCAEPLMPKSGKVIRTGFNTVPANVRQDFMTSSPAYSGTTPSRLQVLTQGLRNINLASTSGKSNTVQTYTGQGGNDAIVQDGVLARDNSKKTFASNLHTNHKQKLLNKKFLSSLPATSIIYNQRRLHGFKRDYIPERDKNCRLYTPECNDTMEASWKWNPKPLSKFYLEDSFDDVDVQENVVCKSQSTVAASRNFALSGYFPNIGQVNSNILCRDKVSHLCAINPRDGSTLLHRLFENKDSVQMLKAILDVDGTVVNIQNAEGLSPLHTACLYSRKRSVEYLVNLPYIDLNLRTLNGKLPEEMTDNKLLVKLVQRAREMDNDQTPLSSPFPSRPSSTTGASSVDFEKINSRFTMLKRTLQ